MTTLLLVVMVLFLVAVENCSGCNGTLSASQPEREGVVIPALGIALSLPAHYAVHSRGEEDEGPWVIDLNPGGRGVRRIVLEPVAPDVLQRPGDHDPDCPWLGPETTSLWEGGVVEFFTSVGCGGSGGVEADLVGHWELGERRFALRCETQGEPVFDDGPDPDWCLDLLRIAHLVPVLHAPPRLGPTGVERPITQTSPSVPSRSEDVRAE